MKIDREVLERQLKTRWAGRVIRQFDSIDSTNLEGFVYTAMNAFHVSTVTIVGQNVGAGRYERIHRVLFESLLLVTGVGINVNMTEFPEQAGGQAVSLRQALGHPVERETLIARILEAFEAYYEVFEAAEDLSGLRDEYNSQLVNLGRQVKVLDPMEPFQGEALGIDSQGNLLVKMPDGGIRTVRSGEVSVRGIYGYAL